MSFQPVGSQKTISLSEIWNEEDNLISMAKSLVLSIPMMLGTALSHEGSHIIAMRILFPEVTFSISCNFPVWRVNFEYLSETSKLDEQIRLGLESAAGPLSDLFWTTISSAASWKLRNSNPNIAIACAVTAVANSMNLFRYCATSEGTASGDFYDIEQFLGIPHRFQTIVTGVVAFSTLLLAKNAIYSALKEMMSVNAKKNSVQKSL